MIFSRRLPGILYTYKYTIYSTLILSVTLIYFLFKWNYLCSNLQAWRHVRKMCQLYEDGEAVGALCDPLCATNEINSVVCHSFRATKEAVFSAEMHNSRLVFKSVNGDVQKLHWYDNGVPKYPTEKEFLATIRALVKDKLNLTVAYETALRLSRLRPSFEEKDVLKRRTEMDNIWTLMQDNEYLLSMIFADKDVFPLVVGTCGPYFAVEYVAPVQEISSFLSVSDTRQDWGRRLKLAVQILELLDELETAFREPLHLCDVKLDHFGTIGTETKLKFIDLDGVYPKSIISRMISRTTDCHTDDDCELFDCRTKCNQNNICNTSIGNNNLQIVCEKIFLGWRLSNTVIVPGLLISQHTPSELASILRQCANPDNVDGKPRTAPPEDIKKRLYNVLSEIEQTVNNDFFL